MNSPTSQIVEQAIAKQEAEEAGIVVDDDSKNPKGGDDDKPKDEPKKGAEDDKAGKPKSGEDDKPAGDKGDADKSDKKDEEEGEFTADDALEVETPKQPDQPAAPTDNAGIQLSTAEQKHIADNIGEPIVIKGFTGEGDNLKEVEIKAYSPRDIPANFKFANDQQLLAAQEGFRQLENRAQQLLGNYRQTQSQTAAQDFERRENEGIRQDVADLQKEGRMPKFRVQPGAEGFDDDPAAKQMAEVLQIMSDKNDTYLKQFQQGRPYRHIGFAEAFDIWERNNPSKQAEKAANDKQADEDKDRKRGAERGNQQPGTEPSGNIIKPTVGAGTSTRDILARIDALE